jgi:hypothetical protein
MTEEKKIIVDEDWKSQVEAEKEALKREAQSKQTDKPAAERSDVSDPPMPPASFDLLLSTLATEAMVALGAFPNPVTGKYQSHPNQAKYLIDMIAVLQEKTKGNLTPSEVHATEGLLHQLRMAYVEATTAYPAGAAQAAGGDSGSAAQPPQ